MKTISELNSKVWYRFLKVIYVLLFILGLFYALIGGFFVVSPTFVNEKSYIKCNDGREFTLNELGISLPGPYVPYQGYEDIVIKQNCGSTQWEKNNGYYVKKNYTLMPSLTRDWFTTIGLSVFYVIVTIIIFQLIKRVFYYIILGSFRPPK